MSTPADALPILRSHALQKLLRLTPENTDLEALERFIGERAQILGELEAIKEPWTREEQDILAAAMRHAEQIMAELEALQAQVAQQIAGLQKSGAWQNARAAHAAAKITRRF